MLKTVTPKLIRQWEIEHGESFFDQHEMINVSFLLGFIFGKYTHDEFMLWSDAADEHTFLNSVIENVYSNCDYDEESYIKSLTIVCELINLSEIHNKRFWDFLAENPI